MQSLADLAAGGLIQLLALGHEEVQKPLDVAVGPTIPDVGSPGWNMAAADHGQVLHQVLMEALAQFQEARFLGGVVEVAVFASNHLVSRRARRHFSTCEAILLSMCRMITCCAQATWITADRTWLFDEGRCRWGRLSRESPRSCLPGWISGTS
ncbi:MAG: hypothetical protein ABSC05_36505 [Candidatus Solibacter sp.]